MTVDVDFEPRIRAVTLAYSANPQAYGVRVHRSLSNSCVVVSYGERCHNPANGRETHMTVTAEDLRSFCENVLKLLDQGETLTGT